MRGTWSLTRCPCPTHTRGGVLRCVVALDGCSEHRWSVLRRGPLLHLAAVVWWLRPWWPNSLGRAQDRGEAHVCPAVHPCRACLAPRTPCTDVGCPWWVETGGVHSNQLMLRQHLREDH